ncbi:hypothetical protein [Algoriphagus pacificus]|uniref:Lipocalin-like domain-containing protein n=1 Tax=Algoriphagus pacificus TaxID=2811234 RepID=A0ABS3CHD5_9BACT|nr:hypothetical protein [Algoriphagus pacificus]MBN7816508.1 hypothetical protein [Algoriphagus pacificus]
MKPQLLLLSILLLTVFSCKSEDDINPENKILGLYEFKLEKVGNNYELDFVNTLDFKSDGTVYGEAFTTKAGTNEVLGYRYYFNGIYEIKNDKVSISDIESFHSIFMDTFYSPKSDLVNLDEGMAPEEYLIKDEFQTLQIVCPANANCFNMEFKKIN